MRIESSAPSNLGLLGRAPGMIPEWRVGAVVEAVAVRDAAGQLWLRLGQMHLPARLASGNPDGPADGEALRLKVLRNSPVLAFEALGSDTAAGADPTGDALRRVLPRQTSPAALLASLASLANPKATNAPLPQQIIDGAARLWAGLPPATQLTDPAGLATALARSGLFMETRLAVQSGAALRGLPQQDLKALLLGFKELLASQGGRSTPLHMEATAPLPMLRGSLQPLSTAVSPLASAESPAAAIDSLSRETEGALSRLTATQLINSGAGGLAWLVEIPVRHDAEARLLRFRFERESAEESGDQTGWTVEAALELNAGEAVHARVSLRQRRISIQLRSDAPHVVSRLQAHSGQLSAALEAAGLNVDQIVCLHGLPVDDAGRPQARLVDLRA